MRKEVVFAIIIGLFLGAVILIGWQLADRSAKQAASTSQAKPDLAPPETPTPVAQSISLTSPRNHAIVNTNSVKITGKTFPNTPIAISDSEDDAIVTTDKDGNFSLDLTLTGGANLIKLTVLKDDHTTDSTQVTVIYTTAKITSSDDVLEPITASPSAIVDKVVKAALDKNLKSVQDVNLLVGYTGVISDIKQGVFDLDTDETDLQISYDSKTTIIKDGKSLKSELLSVNDKAIVIGNMSSPDILMAKRIVISTKDDGPVLEKKVIFSSIVKIKGNLLTLNVDGKNQDVTLGKKLKLDPKTLTTNNKIFGILLADTDLKATLLQAKIL